MAARNFADRAMAAASWTSRRCNALSRSRRWSPNSSRSARSRWSCASMTSSRSRSIASNTWRCASARCRASRSALTRRCSSPVSSWLRANAALRRASSASALGVRAPLREIVQIGSGALQPRLQIVAFGGQQEVLLSALRQLLAQSLRAPIALGQFAFVLQALRFALACILSECPQLGGGDAQLGLQLFATRRSRHEAPTQRADLVRAGTEVPLEIREQLVPSQQQLLELMSLGRQRAQLGLQPVTACGYSSDALAQGAYFLVLSAQRIVGRPDARRGRPVARRFRTRGGGLRPLRSGAHGLRESTRVRRNLRRRTSRFRVRAVTQAWLFQKIQVIQTFVRYPGRLRRRRQAPIRAAAVHEIRSRVRAPFPASGAMRR